MKRSTTCGLITCLTFASFSLPNIAGAAEEIDGRRYGDIAAYPLELDAHFSFGAENVYGNTGFGGGLRFSVPLAAGSIGRVPDNIALSFGGDFLRYENCYFNNHCGANYVLIPVAAQWNLFAGRSFSFFGEGGAFLYKGFFDGCAGEVGCSAPSDFGVLPTLAIGMRIHIGDAQAITARLGYPTTTIGFSFL